MGKIEILFDDAQIKEKVAQLGKVISDEFHGKNLLVLGVLNGSFVFMADLVRYISLENVEIKFIKAKSYLGTQTTGNIAIEQIDQNDFSGKDILVVEDIIDTGLTLKAIKEKLVQENVNSVKIAVFLDKPSRRTVDITPDYCCFEIPDKFVVGYGLDYNEKYRQLPYLGVIV